MLTITVPLGDNAYPIYIERGILARSGSFLRELYGEITAAIVTDDHVAPLYLQQVEDSLLASGLQVCSIVLPHGEQTKCLQQLSALYDFLSAQKITRRDAVIALGGGVMGDLAGLAAATWLRGVHFVQMPTTLLAQVDSSVGGKVAVDLPQGKNLVGAFYQPDMVLCDPDTLQTLTDEYWRDGLGEVVKYGCIGDGELFSLLEQHASGGRAALMQIIDVILSRCIRAKADVVAQDERDTGLRMTLNFGHTIAHAVETCQRYAGLRHGEAVALGMRLMTRLTEDRGMTVPGTSQRLENLLSLLELPTALPPISEEDLLRAMTMDKKSEGRALRIVALKGIGECFIHTASPEFFRGMSQINA